MEALTDILQQLQAGQCTRAQAEAKLRELVAQPLGFATVDHARPLRSGSSEVIFASGKTPSQVVMIARAILKHAQHVLITRCDQTHGQALRKAFKPAQLTSSTSGHTVLVFAQAKRKPAKQKKVSHPANILIVSAGTSDQIVAEEAMLTCQAMGEDAQRISDVGVAGLHRLGARLAELRAARVIICIAGMEGALPSVLAGLVTCPLIAVPTSVGYGASFGGLAPLLTMLNSCAPGITVTNIDNGYGAAVAACRMMNMMRAEHKRIANSD